MTTRDTFLISDKYKVFQDVESSSVTDDFPESVSVCGSRDGSSVSGRRRLFVLMRLRC